MEATQGLLLDLAAIAGIFVGFGALIVFSSNNRDTEAELQTLRGVTTTGLLALVSALLPIVVSGIGLEGRALWATSSAISLVAIWFTLLHPSVRPELVAQLRANPAAAAFFWIFLELPIQLPLLLILAGVFVSHAAALYLASLCFHLFESTQLLVQVVYSRVGRARAPSRNGE